MIMALKSQVSNIRKEITPTIQLSGTRFGTSAKLPIHRRLNLAITPTTSNSIVLYGTQLGTAGMPDGSRIMDFKVTNRSGRRVAVVIPVDSGLCYFGANGNPSTVQKEVWAPLSRFPTLKVNIPDVVTSTIDTNNSTTPLFGISGAPGLSTSNDNFTVSIHYVDYV